MICPSKGFITLAVAITTLLLAGFAYAQIDQTITSTGTSSTLTSSSPSITVSTTGRPRLAVHTFENPPHLVYSTIGTGLTNIIITHLAKSGRFNIIQRGENLEVIAEEIELGKSGYIQQDTAVEKGRLQGVDYILSGKVTNFGYEKQNTSGFFGSTEVFSGVDVSKEIAVVRLDFALIDAETGLTVLAAAGEGSESETGVYITAADLNNWISDINFESKEFIESMIGRATIKAIENLIDQIAPLFPVQASVTATTPDFVILDIGSGSGIDVGSEFEVYRIKEVTNSQGVVVWKNKELIARIRIMETDLTSAKAKVISGSGIMEGDLCILSKTVSVIDVNLNN